LAEDANLEARVFNDSEDHIWKSGSHWVAVARTKEELGKLAEMPDHWTELDRGENAPLWTDDYSGLLRIVNWKW
jgi:hypothetical protein